MSEPSSTVAARILPSQPSLEQYRKQARELLSALRSGAPEAARRFAAHHPRWNHVQQAGARLSDAQLVIAREHGFASWPRFHTHIQSSALQSAVRADAFVEAAIGNRLAAARDLRTSDPEIVRANVYTAAVYGELDALREMLGRAPELSNRPGGPRNRPPLLYAAFSAYIHVRDAEILEAVRLLLEHGADPNAAYREEPYTDWPIPALYGACGVLNHVGLATLLIDAGARLDDNESVYHATEHPDGRCLRLLLERGASLKGTNALKHMLDRDDLAGVQLLLEHGADPNEVNGNGETALHWALYRHRQLPFVRLLVEHGADVQAVPGDGMNAYRMAARLGETDIAAFLAEQGADTHLTESDRVVIDAVTGSTAPTDLAPAGDPAAASADLGRMLTHLAEVGDIERVRRLVEAGAPLDGRGTRHATALHLAAWYGYADVVRLLIESGAPIEATGADLGTTPLNWALHGSGHNAAGRPEDYVKVVEALLAAGARDDPAWWEWAPEAVRQCRPVPAG